MEAYTSLAYCSMDIPPLKLDYKIPTSSQTPSPKSKIPVPSFTCTKCRCNTPPNCTEVVPQNTNPNTASNGVTNIRLYKIRYDRASPRIPSTPMTNAIVGRYTCPVQTNSNAEIANPITTAPIMTPDVRVCSRMTL